jgi:hypothetical protein
MSTPLALSDEEMDVLHRLAAPIAYGRREEFLHAMTAALASCPQPSPGVVYRTARELQKGFTLEAQNAASAAAAPRHLANRPALRVWPVCYWAACKTAPQYEAVVAKRLVIAAREPCRQRLLFPTKSPTP